MYKRLISGLLLISPVCSVCSLRPDGAEEHRQHLLHERRPPGPVQLVRPSLTCLLSPRCPPPRLPRVASLTSPTCSLVLVHVTFARFYEVAIFYGGRQGQMCWSKPLTCQKAKTNKHKQHKIKTHKLWKQMQQKYDKYPVNISEILSGTAWFLTPKRERGARRCVLFMDV